MILKLSPLPQTLKGPAGDGYHGRVPRRALFLAPDAAASLLQLEKDSGGLVYSDIFRSASESLAARQRKSGVQAPGFSGHGYGLAFDLDIKESLRRVGRSYQWLRRFLEDHGWYCHRRDMQPSESEGWHFNYLPDPELIKLADPAVHATWSHPVEAEIQKRYAEDFHLDEEQTKVALAQVHCSTVEEFQTAWGLVADGIAGPRTQRTLAYCTSHVHMEEIPG